MLYPLYGVCAVVAYLFCVELTVNHVAPLKEWTTEHAEIVRDALAIVGVILICIVLGIFVF